jgi:hypothetical protein
MWTRIRHIAGGALLLSGMLAQGLTAQSATPQASVKTKKQPADTATKIEVYGFAQADAIYEFNQSNPDWFDVNRPSRLPASDGQFGRDGRTWLSARQSRFGVKATIPTPLSDIKATFEWDLFGVGADAGQTTIRPRHIYGQWGHFGAGQTNSVFMDVDVFPNTLEYWGPNGMLFFRNVMIWWQPVNSENGTRFTLALERPGASGDAGIYADRIELQNVRPRFPAPDISGEYRLGGGAGYIELAGIVRWISWDDVLDDAFDLSGSVTAWGLSLSSNIKAGPWDVLRLQGVYGAGVENYFNDAPIDVGLASNAGDPLTPVTGEALKNVGISAYLDHRWSSSFTTALGYSRVDIDNSDLQTTDAYRSGQYASVNLLWSPLPNALVGGEVLWADRHNNGNGFSASNYRFQFSVKYSFSQKFGGSGNDVIRAQD